METTKKTEKKDFSLNDLIAVETKLEMMSEDLEALWHKTLVSLGSDYIQKEIGKLNIKIYETIALAPCSKCDGRGTVEVNEAYRDSNGFLCVNVENCDECQGTGVWDEGLQESIKALREELEELKRL